jgi:hypothetical protein
MLPVIVKPASCALAWVRVCRPLVSPPGPFGQGPARPARADHGVDTGACDRGTVLGDD